MHQFRWDKRGNATNRNLISNMQNRRKLADIIMFCKIFCHDYITNVSRLQPAGLCKNLKLVFIILCNILGNVLQRNDIFGRGSLEI